VTNRAPIQRPDARVDRLPPHDNDSEAGVLGCVLLDPKNGLDECIVALPAPEAFFDLKHRTIYTAMLDMQESGDPIDSLTLTSLLRDRVELEACGGLAYVSSLPDQVPSAANLHYYLKIVREKYLLRRMLQVCTEAAGRIYEPTEDVNSLLDDIERSVLSVQEQRNTDAIPTMKELVNGALATMEEYYAKQGNAIGIPTGFVDLDRITKGLRTGDMIVIAGRPSQGKSSLAMNIAENVVLESKIPVGVFSLEMTAQALTMRCICSQARVDMSNISDGFMSERDFPKITGAAGRLSVAKLYIDDISGLSIMQLRARARRMHQKYGIKLLVIDYFQLISGGGRYDNQAAELTMVSNGIKTLAKELHIPIIILSQLNRDLEKDKNRKPRLSDLKGCGALEQDGDVIGLLYNPNRDEEDDNDGIVTANLLIAKQRSGPTGIVPLTFFKKYTRFESAARVQASDIPNNPETKSYHYDRD
jgi:replicative DNA helicase